MGSSLQQLLSYHEPRPLKPVVISFWFVQVFCCVFWQFTVQRVTDDVVSRIQHGPASGVHLLCTGRFRPFPHETPWSDRKTP